MKFGSFQGTILLQSSFPRIWGIQVCPPELAWISAKAGMTESNLATLQLASRTHIFEGEQDHEAPELNSTLRVLRVFRG